MSGLKDLKFQDGDLVIEGGNIELVDGAQRVAQSIEARVKTLRGEWFMDRAFGVPYFTSILGKRMIDKDAMEAVVKTEILKAPGVNRIVSFESEFDHATRVYSIEFVADTIYGPLTYTGVVTS